MQNSCTNGRVCFGSKGDSDIVNIYTNLQMWKFMDINKQQQQQQNSIFWLQKLKMLQ